jgi:hypothetical protein
MPSNSVPLKGEKGWDVLMKQRREFWAKPANSKLSTNFRGQEFYCNDGSAAPTNAQPAMKRLCVVFLEPMRKKFGTCFINSGYRHTLYNASIGGAVNSQHIYDHTYENVAADVRFAKGNPTQWAAELKRIRASKNGGKGGVGLYVKQGFVHIDNRAYKADWTG